MDRLSGEDDVPGLRPGSSDSSQLLRAIDELRELDRAKHLAASPDDEIMLADRVTAKAREIFRMVNEEADGTRDS